MSIIPISIKHFNFEIPSAFEILEFERQRMRLQCDKIQGGVRDEFIRMEMQMKVKVAFPCRIGLNSRENKDRIRIEFKQVV